MSVDFKQWWFVVSTSQFLMMFWNALGHICIWALHRRLTAWHDIRGIKISCNYSQRECDWHCTQFSCVFFFFFDFHMFHNFTKSQWLLNSTPRCGISWSFIRPYYFPLVTSHKLDIFDHQNPQVFSQLMGFVVGLPPFGDGLWYWK